MPTADNSPYWSDVKGALMFWGLLLILVMTAVIVFAPWVAPWISGTLGVNPLIIRVVAGIIAWVILWFFAMVGAGINAVEGDHCVPDDGD